MLANLTVKACELRWTAHPPDAKHSTFPSSERLMGIFSMVVQLTACFPIVDSIQSFERSAIWRRAIGDDCLYLAVPLLRFPEEFQCRLLLALLRHETYEDLAFMIDRTPEKMLHPADIHENFVEASLSTLKRPHRLDSLGRILAAKIVPKWFHKNRTNKIKCLGEFRGHIALASVHSRRANRSDLYKGVDFSASDPAARPSGV